MKRTRSRKSIVAFCFLYVAFSSRICLCAMLGVQTSDTGGGVLVPGVVPGTAADEVGLQSGDIIISIDGKVVNAEELRNFTMSKSAGYKTEVIIKRGGEEKKLSIALGERPPDPDEMFEKERKAFTPPDDMKPAPYGATSQSQVADKRMAEALASIDDRIESTPPNEKTKLAGLYFEKAKLYGPLFIHAKKNLETAKSLLNESSGNPELEKEIAAFEGLSKKGPHSLKLYRNFSEYVFNGNMDGLKMPNQAAVSKGVLAVRDYDKKCVLLFTLEDGIPFRELADYDILDSMPDGFILGTRWGFIKLITPTGELKKSVRLNKYIEDIYTTKDGDIYILGATGLVTRISPELEVVDKVQLGASGTNALNHPAFVHLMGLSVWGGKYYVRFNMVSVFDSNGHLEKVLDDFRSSDMRGIEVLEDGRILAGTGAGVLISSPDYEYMELNKIGTSFPDTAPDQFRSIDDMKIVEIDGKKLLLTADMNKGRVALFELMD